MSVVNEIMDRDAERPAYVRFEKRAIQDKQASLVTGHFVSKDVDYILVTPPYSRDCIEKSAEKFFQQKMVDVKKGRVPQAHFDYWKRAYEAWKEGQEAPVDGSPLRDWNGISPSQFKNLQAAGCRTIEDVAQMNDEGIRRVGMGAANLKNRARLWLQAAKDHGPLVGELADLKRENEQLSGAVESLRQQVQRLTQEHLATETPSEDPTDTISASDILDEDDGEQALAERYIQRFGKPPHPRMKDSTIRERLRDDAATTGSEVLPTD